MLTKRIRAKLHRRKVEAINKLMREAYPDEQERALVLLGEGARSVESLAFRHGQTVKAITLHVTEQQGKTAYRVHIA